MSKRDGCAIKFLGGLPDLVLLSAHLRLGLARASPLVEISFLSVMRVLGCTS